jgi:5'-nucleotidase/UDP-sugar diphosphatase
MIESIRKGEPSVLLLDSGAVFDHQSDNAKLHLQAMELMGYDALNLGIPELLLGKEFLERTSSQVTFPYIASNLLYGGSRLPWTREYVIKEVGGMKVAILGILDPDDLKKIPPHDDVKGFTVISPGDALDRLLPEVRGKADLVILLSQLGEARTLALVEAARGIDVAISSRPGSVLKVKPPENAAVILDAGSEGLTMGLVTITLDGKRVLMSEGRDVPLDLSVPDNKRILGLVETYKKEQAIKEEKMEKERMEWLQLTPEEFIKRYRERQTEQKKGAAQ